MAAPMMTQKLDQLEGGIFDWKSDWKKSISEGVAMAIDQAIMAM